MLIRMSNSSKGKFRNISTSAPSASTLKKSIFLTFAFLNISSRGRHVAGKPYILTKQMYIIVFEICNENE